MSFNPDFTKYINFNTASYIEPSSSVGPTGISTLMSNQEWLYHGVNSQVLINSNFRSKLFSVSTSIADIGKPVFIKSLGPLRLNLNKNGMPQPMFLAFKGGNVQTLGPAYGYFTFVFNSQGTTNSTNGWLNLTSSIQGFYSSSYQTLTGSYQDTEGFFFESTSSVSGTPNNSLSLLTNRTSKTDSNIDSSQLSCLMNLSIFWTQTTANSTASRSWPKIDALYLREVNPYL